MLVDHSRADAVGLYFPQRSRQSRGLSNRQSFNYPSALVTRSRAEHLAELTCNFCMKLQYSLPWVQLPPPRVLIASPSLEHNQAHSSRKGTPGTPPAHALPKLLVGIGKSAQVEDQRKSHIAWVAEETGKDPILHPDSSLS